MPGTPETILAFDYGNRRIGVAVGQTITRSANPVGVIDNSAAGPDRARLESLLGEWQPGRIVVGMPLSIDGSPSPLSADVERFMELLAGYGLSVVTQDERYSSLEARQLLTEERRAGARGRVDKAAIDSAAAVLIAERWLRENS